MEQINASNNAAASNVQQATALAMLKNDLNTAQTGVQQLLKGLPTVQDTALGRNVNILA
jgi:hypothetical protein